MEQSKLSIENQVIYSIEWVTCVVRILI